MPQGHRYVHLRHHIWWEPGGRLEAWDLWRRDRLRELAVQVPAWDLPRAVDGDLPDERGVSLRRRSYGIGLDSGEGGRRTGRPSRARAVIQLVSSTPRFWCLRSPVRESPYGSMVV